MMRALGYEPDKPDARDFAFKASAQQLPYSASLEQILPDVLDQGQLGSCVAQGIAEAIYASHKKQGYVAPKLCSRMFVWYLARAFEQKGQQNAGVSIRDAFSILNWFGFCPESVMPYDDSLDGNHPAFTRMPPISAFRAASDQRGPFGQANPAVYHRISGSDGDAITAIKTAIVSQKPVVFGVDVDEAFTQNNFNPDAALHPPTNPVGGHCMVAAGFIGDSFIIRNSWGMSFGNAGSCLFTADYMLQAIDMWVVDHSPQYTEGG